MKIAMVFSGGGAKGAYQIGVWKALDELELVENIQTIAATSIGNINSILFINNDIDNAILFWENLKRSDIAPIPRNIFEMLFRGSISKKDNLRNIVESYINFNNLYYKNIEIITLCTQLCMGFPIKKIFKLHEQSKEEVVNIILASCTVPLFFRAQKLSQYPKSYFYDGGVVGRTPIKCLDYEKYDKIIVVHPDNLNRLNLIKYNRKKYINIYPSIFQGLIFKGAYGFKKEYSKKRIEAGYRDGLKYLKKLINNKEVENETR